MFKKLFFLTALSLGALSTTTAQEFGVKLGANLSSASNATNDANSILKTNSKSFISYNAGVYAQVNLLGFFVRPELIISSEGTNTDIIFPAGQGSATATAQARAQITPVVTAAVEAAVPAATPNRDAVIAAQVSAGVDAQLASAEIQGTINATEQAFQNANGTYKTEVIYATLPVLVGKTFAAKKLGIYTGVNFKVAIGGDNAIPQSIDKNARRVTLSVPFGAYFQLTDKIAIDARYNFGISEVREDIARVSPVPSSTSNLNDGGRVYLNGNTAAPLTNQTGQLLSRTEAGQTTEDPNPTRFNTIQIGISYKLFGLR